MTPMSDSDALFLYDIDIDTDPQGSVPAHANDFITSLYDVVNRHCLSKTCFDSIMKIREEPFEPFSGKPESVVGQSEGTMIHVLRLGMEIGGFVSDVCMELAGLVGRSLGVCSFLDDLRKRATEDPHFLNVRRLGTVSMDHLIRSNTQPSALMARTFLETARTRMNEIDHPARPCLLSAVMADTFLSQLERGNYDRWVSVPS
eukprot:TRINITY_DN1343_c0_g1_i4.p1 TRINITY_DN1343_c0_g1~~TRINITY_DN1343_c0_g1_i4.p1  ORF type:complete len:202 (-),score=33.16 TRINITY_DN1343_c0_g1_i4:507-1112(-)